jgi:ribosomal protein S18 acetylase RimI-like enzyme
MGSNFIKLAKELDYVASFFNLVYENNPASVNLWRSLGFKEIGLFFLLIIASYNQVFQK